MDKFEIEGGVVLNGSVEASGSKNASLPILFASILSAKKIILERVPQLKDIQTSIELIKGLGAEISKESNNRYSICAERLQSIEAPYDLVRTMRASILLLAPILAREGKARVSLPGGCSIGSRPVDIHLKALEQMGVKIEIASGYVNASVEGKIKGADIGFRFPSVGATEQIIMAGTLAEGETTIRNAAREPEIVDLANFLNSLGAKIEGAGSDCIKIKGVSSLEGGSYSIMFDRIEAGTILLAGAITGGKVRVEKIVPNDLLEFLSEAKKSGVKVIEGNDWIEFEGKGSSTVSITTAPHPGFATDLQAQMMSFLCEVPGTSTIVENIFENRFMHVPELVRLGADISISGSTAQIRGKNNTFSGATVMATDLRASAALVLAGLVAKGTTSVRRIYHLDRGYESLEAKISLLGGKISRQRE
ncbi:MAG: UDP-N-acetylglucosamine 1-carboxyvinyltransferase [Oligoflexia bacterium]|nr:UDP-N-acetylglucosamine 1-carboxyvinyltransferase [Oligoflexia bacterium]